MNNIDLMNYWIKSSDEDFVTMEILYKNKQNAWCLYIGQLVIEKLLKASESAALSLLSSTIFMNA